MAINTLITIKDALTAFVAGHGQLKAIKFEADDHRAPVITESDSFPLLFVAPIDVQVGRAMNAHTLRIYVYERINDDRSDVLENANDTSLILRDIRVWWNDYGVDDIEIKEDPTGIFVSDRELDNLVGYYADIRFEIPSHGRCSVPVDITPIDPVTCEDATYEVEYENGTPIESGSIPSGGFELIVVPNPITCADAVVNVNSVFFDNVASGGTLNIEVRKSSGSDLVGSKQGQYWRIGDSTAVLKTTGGATISTTSIKAEESEDITAPDATVTNSDATYVNTVVSGGTLVLPDITVTDSDGSTYTQPSVENVVCTLSPDTSLEVNGTPEGTFTAGSTIEVNITDGVNPVTPDNVTVVGDVVTIEVPSGGGWVRPSDWLTMPTVTSAQDTFVGLYAVFPSGNNFAAFRFTTSTGQYQVDWGDGVVDLVNSNIVAEHTYDYSTYDPTNATLSTRGYKQAIITVTPVTGMLTLIDLQRRATTSPIQGTRYATGFLDIKLSLPNHTAQPALIGGVTVKHSYLEQAEIMNLGSCNSVNSLFADCHYLQSIPQLNIGNATSGQFMFLDCYSLVEVPLFDTSNFTILTSMFSGCRSLKEIPLLNTSSATNVNSMFNGCSALRSIPLLNISNVTSTAAMFINCASLQSIPLLNTSLVTNMEAMFNNCASIQEIPTLSTSAMSVAVGTYVNFAAGCLSLDRCNMVFQRAVSFQNGQLSQGEIVNIFNNLSDRSATTAANINISSNWGASALTVGERAIATGKNWTITG